jgi:hypothetical protein
MRSLVVTNVESVDLTGNRPFGPNHTVVALNATGTAEVLQSADVSGGSFATIATIPAGEAVEVVINRPFLQLVDAGTIVLLAN